MVSLFRILSYKSYKIKKKILKVTLYTLHKIEKNTSVLYLRILRYFGVAWVVVERDLGITKASPCTQALRKDVGERDVGESSLKGGRELL